MHTSPHLPTTGFRSRTVLRWLGALLVIVVLSAGCSSGSDSETASGGDVAEEDRNPVTGEVVTPMPETTEQDPAGTGSSDATPAAEVLDWVVMLLNDDAPDPDAVASKFSANFLAAVPIEQIIGLLPQLNSEATGPWSITSSQIGEYEATAVLSAEGSTSLNAMLNVGTAKPHLIEGLRFTPALDAPTISTVEEYQAALADLAPVSRVGVFELVDGECQVVIDMGADQVMPIGSIFKLWILAELAHQVQAGQASWDETLPVQDELKSSPDGTIFNLAAGTELTLRRFAEEMISISDNGATDHLLARVGRENVETAMATSGVADPSLNIPFLSSTDLFRIKFHPDAPNSSDYRALDAAGRRAVLQAFEGTVAPWIENPDAFPMVNADGVDLSQPRDHDLEWFATPYDLCRTHAYLGELALQPGLEPIADILSMNADAGMPFDRATWTALRFKGGSEQGITAVAWWMQRNDGRVFVLAGGVENEQAPINSAAAVAVLQQGAKLVAQHP